MTHQVPLKLRCQFLDYQVMIISARPILLSAAALHLFMLSQSYIKRTAIKTK